jgi:hypothetical protein
MPEVDGLAIVAATAAAFISGGAYYALLGERLAQVSEAAAAAEQPGGWTIVVELLRCLVLAAVVAGLAAEADIDGLAGGLCLGLALWVGFPLVLWTGAIIHERTPWKLATIHAGDWLLKLLLIAVLVSLIP